MKRNKIIAIMISIILMSMLSSMTLVYANNLDVSCNIVEKASEYRFDYHGTIIEMERNNKISNIWWTGREFIIYNSYNGEFKRSVDLANWELISINRELWKNGADYAYMWEPVIEYYNGIYIIRDTIYENVNEIMAQLSWGDTLRSSSILIFDENFSLIKQVDFEYQMTAFSYVNGRFYVRMQDYVTNYGGSYQPINKIYVSEDTINWYADENLTEVPLSNQKNILTFGDGRYNSVSYSIENYATNEMSIVNSDGEKTKTIFEKIPYITYDVADELYISYEKYSQTGNYAPSFKASLDGLYWHEVPFPIFEKYEQIMVYMQMGNKLLFQTDKRLLEYDIEEIKQAIIAKNGLNCTYVKVNGEILGFDTPPITEADRTLVPMRFLFEQLGAEVEWDDATNTATATIAASADRQIQTFGMAEEKTVSFSIDNPTATVNGTAASMDVPARLMNDKTMVPLRFLSENLGYTVTWDEATKTATVE